MSNLCPSVLVQNVFHLLILESKRTLIPHIRETEREDSSNFTCTFVGTCDGSIDVDVGTK